MSIFIGCRASVAPLKSISELRQLYQHYPAQWQIIKEMDIKAYNKFRADYSIAELEDRFKKELRYEQITL